LRKNERDKVSIRIDLEGVIAKRFNLLKNHFGLKTNSSLIRLIISREYQRELITMDDISPSNGKLYQVEGEREKDHEPLA